MKKLLKRIAICFLIVVLWWLCTLLADRLTLRQGLIRFHVVANSDSTADQAIKENVRDAVLASIQDDIRKIADIIKHIWFYGRNKTSYNQHCRNWDMTDHPALHCAKKLSMSVIMQLFPYLQEYMIPCGL